MVGGGGGGEGSCFSLLLQAERKKNGKNKVLRQEGKVVRLCFHSLYLSLLFVPIARERAKKRKSFFFSLFFSKVSSQCPRSS